MDMFVNTTRHAKYICFHLLHLAIRIILSLFRFVGYYLPFITTLGLYYLEFVDYLTKNYDFMTHYRRIRCICYELIIANRFKARHEQKICATDIISKYVVITDGSSHYGRDIARVMRKRGAHVMVGNQTHTGDVQSRDNVWTIQLDMVSLVSVRAFAQQVLQLTSGHPIDILILNACYFSDTLQREETENFERHFAANHLGNLIIINALRERLTVSRSARVVIESSASYKIGEIHFGNLNLIHSYTTLKAYFQTKLANILLAHSIAQQTDGAIRAYSVNPGCSHSEMKWSQNTELPFIEQLIYLLFNVVCNRSQYSIHTTLYCALDDSVLPHSGGYYSDCQRKNVEIDNIDNKAMRLWDASCDMLGIQRNILFIQ